MGGPQGRSQQAREPSGRSGSGGPEPKAYLERSDREEAASGGRGNKPHGDGFARLRPSQVLRPMSRKGRGAIVEQNDDDSMNVPRAQDREGLR